MIPLPVSQSIAAFLKDYTGKAVTLNSTIPLGGGCINEAVKILSSAGVYFAKYNLTETYPGMFACEAAGLNLLRKVDKIHIPEVIHHGDAEKYSYLLLEFIHSESRQYNFWEVFGRSLAAIHKQTHLLYGLDQDNYIGSLPQCNFQHADWTSFFILERLQPMVKKARDKGEISLQLAGKFELLFSKLNAYFPNEKPALLHGDLWNGNYIVDYKGYPCLIDPAVYFGHREMDLAMTKLFGGFAPPFYESYTNAFSLEKGWEERVDLFNLYPLLVHVNLFGGGYASQVKEIVLRFV
jgi:protein-ribulosamine 3-kinase